LVPKCALLLRCSDLFNPLESDAETRRRRAFGGIGASMCANCPENIVRIGAPLYEYPGAALTLAGVRQQTLAK
jgi:hypothetical protein